MYYEICRWIFVYDLTEKLQDQKGEYFLVTVRKGKVKRHGRCFLLFGRYK